MPWNLGFQGSESVRNATCSTGLVACRASRMAELQRLPTTEDMKARLLVRLVSRELGWPEERVTGALQELQVRTE